MLLWTVSWEPNNFSSNIRYYFSLYLILMVVQHLFFLPKGPY